MTKREQIAENLRKSDEARERMKVHEAAVWQNIAEVQALLAAAGYPVRETEAPAPPAPPARPVRRAVQALTPAGGNWSVMTGDPSVHVEVDGSFVL